MANSKYHQEQMSDITNRGQVKRNVLLGCNKNYVTLDPNYMLKNLKKILLISETCKKDKNKNKRLVYIKLLKE